MAKDQALPTVSRGRGSVPRQGAAAAAAARAEAHAPKRPFNPVLFAREVRAEARKISWPSRRETWITSVMVLIMVVITAVFFFVVDFVLSVSITQVLKLGG